MSEVTRMIKMPAILSLKWVFSLGTGRQSLAGGRDR